MASLFASWLRKWADISSGPEALLVFKRVVSVCVKQCLQNYFQPESYTIYDVMPIVFSLLFQNLI